MLYNTMQCYAKLCYAMLYSTMFQAKYLANMLNNFVLNAVDVKL